ncbi:MAG: diacylglycerol kinase family lipid kinase [Deltaproteobacteria bacterium]|nr:diacylglycerol kinase family lipid kinase [Deltaproteobacteria bacterium]
MRFQKPMVVVNPNSAGGATGRAWRSLRRLFETHLPGHEARMTAAPGDATKITRDALRAGCDLIVSVGGDGTNNEIVNGFFDGGAAINAEAVFASIPCGTGGDLRKTLGLPKTPEAAIASLPDREIRAVDIGHLRFLRRDGRDDERFFLNIAGFGVSGVVDEHINRATKLLPGKLSYAWSSLVAILGYQNRNVRLTIDGRDIGSRRVFTVAVANGRFFGGGMMIAPDAVMDDGLFDIVIMGDMSIATVIRKMSAIYKGTHVRHPEVESFRGREIRADADEDVFLDVDGEAPGKLPATFTIRPGALRMLR